MYPSEFAGLWENGGKNKVKEGEGGEKLKAPCSHKVTLKASLITSAFCLSLSRKHDYVNIKRVRPRGTEENESFMVTHVREKVCSGVL